MLRLKVFGGLSIGRDQVPVEGAGAQRRRLALLALLDGAGERGLTRDKILGFLWPESEPEKARRILTQALYALRRDLGEEDLFLGSNEVRLNPDLITSDRIDFQRAIEAGQLDRAVACYSGPFLDGFYVPEAPEFERWVEIERAAFQNQYAGALEELAAAAAARGESRAAIVWWRKLAALDPDPENFRAMVQYNNLLKQYEKYARSFGLLGPKGRPPEKTKSITDVLNDVMGYKDEPPGTRR